MLLGCGIAVDLGTGQTTWEAEARAARIDHLVDAEITVQHEQPSWLNGTQSTQVSYVVEDGAVLADPTALVLWTVRTLWSLRRGAPEDVILITMRHEDGTGFDVDWTEAIHRLPGSWAHWSGPDPADDLREVGTVVALNVADAAQLVTGEPPLDPPSPPQDVFVMPQR